MNPVIFIVGPTCSGKTELAFYLAHQFKARIINADSLQVYQYLDIGTAKPNLKKWPKIDCHLFDHIEPPQMYTAGQYEKDARLILEKYLPQQICLVVGGSGFYIQALEKGCYPIPATDNLAKEQLLKDEKTLGLSVLYEELKEKDLRYAQKVHPHDRYRIFRALSVLRSKGIKISQVQKRFKVRTLPYRFFKLGLTGSYSHLRNRVHLRTTNMIQRGLIGEVQFLKNLGLENFSPLKSVGYKETLLHLEGRISEEELFDHIVNRTMRLIRKQKIWFKRDAAIRWYDCQVDFHEVAQDLKSRL